VFTGYGAYNGAPATSSSMHGGGMSGESSHIGTAPMSSSAAGARATPSRGALDDTPDDLFPDLPDVKKRKFILVEDSERNNRLRVRVTLDGVDTREIPDSFRKSSSVYPRSYFPREMQSPPPSATGSRFFTDDVSDVEDDGATETEGRGEGRGTRRLRNRGRTMVKVPITEGRVGEVAIPRMRKSFRGKEVRLNDLGYRMAWLQSRVFAGRTVFLQRARKFLRLSDWIGVCEKGCSTDGDGNSRLLPQQNPERHGEHHAGRQDGRPALRDPRRKTPLERAHALGRGEGGVE
jgi:hypothetical protein